MHGTRTTVALVFASALLLSGCSAGGGGPTSAADACASVQVALRDVSNGALIALVSASDPGEIQADLEGSSERAGELAEKAENPDVAYALDARRPSSPRQLKPSEPFPPTRRASSTLMRSPSN